MLAGVLLVAAVAVRVRSYSECVVAGEVRLTDLDTMRRLVRLEASDRAESYPFVEVRDGFPQGTVSHWTRPLDVVLRVLDPVARALGFPGTRYESAVLVVGPFLGVLGLLVYLAGAVRWLGAMPGLLAASFYTLLPPLCASTAAGNGDHQSLQHLLLSVFVWLWLPELAGKIGRWAAPASGAALGAAIWVSSESLSVAFIWVLATAVMQLVPRWREPNRAALELSRSLGLLVTLGVAVACEQDRWFAFEWDKVSCFQIYPLAVHAAFLAAVAFRCKPVWAAAGALAVGLLGLWAVPGLSVLLGGELDRFAEVNRWLQGAVSEFRGLFDTGNGWSAWEGGRRFTPWFFVAPLLGVAMVRDSTRPLPARVGLGLLGLSTLGLALHEVKLGHLFAIPLPLITVLGAQRLAAGRRWGRPELGYLFAAALVVPCLVLLPDAKRSPVLSVSDEAQRELARYLAARPGAERGSVLAPWDLGASLLYRSPWPVVASGYHRNLAGIHDAYRFYLAQPEEDEAAREILERRKVRFVVAWYDRSFFTNASRVLGGARAYFDRATARFTESATRSLFWRLRFGPGVPWLRRCYQSEIEVSSARGQKPLPIFTVFEVRGR